MSPPVNRRQALQALAKIDPRVGQSSAESLWAAQTEYRLLQASRLGGHVIDSRVAKQLAKLHAKNFGTSRLARITEGTQGKIKALVEKSIDQGASMTDLASAIKREFSSFSQARAQTIARTEITASTGWATNRGYAAAGIETKVWVSTSANVRDTHAGLDGEEIEINDAWQTENGSAQHPGGFGVAAEDVNCLCVMAPGRGRAWAYGELRAFERSAMRSQASWKRQTLRLFARIWAEQARAVVKALSS